MLRLRLSGEEMVFVREEEEMLLTSSWHPSHPFGKIGGVLPFRREKQRHGDGERDGR